MCKEAYLGLLRSEYWEANKVAHVLAHTGGLEAVLSLPRENSSSCKVGSEGVHWYHWIGLDWLVDFIRQ